VSDTPGVRRFRKRPVTDDQVEAVQLLDDDACDWDAIAAWCGGEHQLHEIADSGEYDSYVRIPAPALGSGYLWATMTDWIVKRELGWMILDAVSFAETYEPATAPGNPRVVTWTATREKLIEAVRDRKMPAGMLEGTEAIAAIADAILAQLPEAEPDDASELESMRLKVADYENRITWNTNCGEHARLLDSCRANEERAERAEVALSQAVAALRRLSLPDCMARIGQDEVRERARHAEGALETIGRLAAGEATTDA
jgi:hypothetical protein